MALAEVEALQAKAQRVETDVSGCRLVWHIWGQGDPVILLHGGAGSWRHWVKTIPALASRYRVIAADSPGLGESDTPPQPWTLDLSAKILAGGIEQLLPADEMFQLVGFSAGAMLGGLVAERLADRCQRLVLVGAGGLDTGRHKILLESVRSKTGDARRSSHIVNLSRLMIADPAKIDEQALAIQDWNTTHTRVNSVSFATSSILKDALSRSTVPLRAIWGSLDAPAIGSLEQRCQTLRELRPEIDIAIIDGAGHWVAYEAPDDFNKVLLSFLMPASGTD